MILDNIDEKMNIQYLKGVGPKRSVLLNHMGIYTVKDLIEHFPRNYEDRSKLYKIKDVKVGEYALFMGRVKTSMQVKKIRKNLTIYSTYVNDDTEKIKLIFYNQTFVLDKLKQGQAFLFYGKVGFDLGGLYIDTPKIYNIHDLDKVQGYYPVYSLTNGITQNYIFSLINALYEKDICAKEYYSEEFKKQNGLCDINFALKNIHFSRSKEAIEQSRKRFIFDELFFLELALMTLKNASLSEQKATVFKPVDIEPFLKLLPFELTNAQKNVIEEIKKDMYSDRVMNRLVQGDVGSGKTIVAAIAMYIAVKNGFQAAMMAPTTILANQHYEELEKYYEVLGIKTEIITSSTTKKNKEKIVEKLQNHEIDVIIGTHSLIEDNIVFDNLGLVITDEQHRFGVKQRVRLTSKGKSVDTLVMTATPIPRTLAIILYGDLDISIIDEMPKGRKPVKTYVVNKGLEIRVNNFVKKQIDEGRQVYVVCPLVEESETLDLKSVENLYEEYKNDIFSEYNVEFLHGKMKNKQKDEIMLRFKNNDINILISTTVIEVGISVSNATIMIIENADRFGLAALHQLRGRVGRGEHQSYCILKSDNRAPKVYERLKIMEQSNSGFDIAQKDLELRGPGDFFGIRQSGLPEFKLANLLTDIEILKDTQEAAKNLIKQDRNLQETENQTIKEELFNRFGDNLLNIGT